MSTTQQDRLAAEKLSAFRHPHPIDRVTVISPVTGIATIRCAEDGIRVYAVKGGFRHAAGEAERLQPGALRHEVRQRS